MVCSDDIIFVCEFDCSMELVSKINEIADFLFA